MRKLRVALTSGYSGSKHAIALLHGISSLPDAEVLLCLEVKTFSYKRIRQLVGMYGIQDAIAKFKNVFLRSPGNRFAAETFYIDEFLQEKGISETSTKQASQILKIGYHKIKSLNEPASIELLKKNKIDLVVYSGGGILGSDFIQSPLVGILNAHSGPLPFFRGMNCLEWTLLSGARPEITIHLIDRGIDTGPILAHFPLAVSNDDTILRLRGKCVVAEVNAIVNVLADFVRYYSGRRTQTPEEGRQFFTMHRYLKAIVEQKIKTGEFNDKTVRP